MSEKETETKGTALAVQPAGHLQDLARLGSWLALAEANDQTEKGLGAAAALRLFWAEQLGLSPMAANDVPLIKGRPYIMASVARALAHKRGYRIEKVDSSAEACTAVIYDRDGQELGRETFTIEQARQAGIVRDKTPWQTYPDRMLWAKAARFVIADYAPEVLLGLGIAEEIGEIIEGEAVELPDEPEEQRAEREPEPATA